MIQIIKPGTKNRVECSYCGALLSFSVNDIKTEEVNIEATKSILHKYIVCPQCGSKVTLEES